ncbi:MAG: toprim domain-containing protein [Deltaproteobacteria bacterium]|nr:toprim domain-containing protein [Deltaproteobacteria bacterium]
MQKFIGALLERTGEGARRCGEGWEARCPAHEDSKPSLSIHEGDAGKALLTCHGGCNLNEITKAVGLKVSDLFPPKEKKAGLGREVARYSYEDEQGQLLFYVVRFDPKTFRPGTPDASKVGGISWGLKGKPVRQVVYLLPQVRAAIERGESIIIVEGEKDALALQKLGVVATCNAGGSCKWRDSHTRCLNGAKRVVIIPDRDDAGVAHAIMVARALAGTMEKVQVLELPGAGKDAADWVTGGGTAEQLDALAADAPDAAAWIAAHNDVPSANESAGSVASSIGLPEIMLTARQFRDVEDDTHHAIRITNDPPRHFLRGGMLVHLPEREGQRQIELVTKDIAFGLLARVASWKRLNQNGNPVDAGPSKDIATQVVVRPPTDLPELRDLVRAPTFTEVGELVAAPGYSERARMWLDLPVTLVVPEVAARPTREQLQAAVALLIDELLGEFPFEAESDRAHALAALLGPATRRLVNAVTPLHAIEAPTPGSGKGLLADVISTVNVGTVCSPTTVPANDDDIRKKITSVLRRAPVILLWDNVGSELDSADFACALTTEQWQDRILGVSDCAVLPNRATWLLTANNPSFSQEIARRTIRIRIDPKLDRPWKRDGFRHADLRGWTLENRGRLLHAVLTLVQAWIAEGKPVGKAKRLGSFERWTEVLGGILDVAQVPGFLENQDELYELADAKGQEQREFVGKWWDEHSGSQMKASQLLQMVDRYCLLPSEVDGAKHQGRLTQLGQVLRALRGKCFGELVVEVEPDTHSKGYWYRLRTASDTATDVMGVAHV